MGAVVALRAAHSWRDVLKPHWAAKAFPPMPTDELRALGEDIAKHGLIHSIKLILVDGEIQVIDGCQRLDSMELVGLPVLDGNDLVEGIPCEFVGATPGFDPVAYVTSLGLRHRHLDETARAMVAAKLVKDPFAKKRTPDRVHAAQAARAMSVSVQSVGRATRVLKHGVPELVAATERGDVKVRAAARIATKPPDEQRAMLAAGDTQEKRQAAPSRNTSKDAKPIGFGREPPESFEPEHILGEIRDLIDAIGGRSREVATITKTIRIELVMDFARMLGVAPAGSLQRQSATGSTAAMAAERGTMSRRG